MTEAQEWPSAPIRATVPVMRTGMRWIWAVAAIVVLASGCGDDEADVSSEGPGQGPGDTVADGAARYTATATVLESPDHGPQLCLGGIATSLPPQCGGPDLIGWDWDAVDDEESASGTTWGEYTIVGTWDGTALTLTEPPRPPDPVTGTPDDGPAFETPCPEPDGGWQVADQATTTEDAQSRAAEYASTQPDVGGVWVDQSINPASQSGPPEWEAMNDPTKLILNISFTDDLERHEQELRAIWGGPLCVSEAPISAADLAEIRAEVEAELDSFLWSSTDEVHGTVEIGTVTDDGLQSDLDERYGAGRVILYPQLQLVPDDS